MKNYIDQLLELFEESKKRTKGKSEVIDLFNYEENPFRDVERYLYEDGVPLSQIFEIEKYNLPEDSALTDSQIKVLADEIEKLWNDYNFYPDFPEGLPPRLKYIKMREEWDKPYVYLKTGMSHIEFCDYENENCPFPDYCNRCAELEEKFRLSEESEQKKQVKNNEKDPFETDDLHSDRRESINDLKNKIKNFDFSKCISGIHNYCDRWCERCNFTGKCAVYLFEKDIQSERTFSDGSGFLEYLSLLFEATGEMILEDMPESIKDLKNENNPVYVESDMDSPLIKLSNSYAGKVNEWYQKGGFCSSLIEMNDDSCEATEVIMWYHLFISAKLYRAGLTCAEPDELNDHDSEISDANGSAKIAIIALKRSIAAWGILLEKHPGNEDEIYSFIKILTALLQNTKAVYPEAESFIRPGLDELRSCSL